MKSALVTYTQVIHDVFFSYFTTRSRYFILLRLFGSETKPRGLTVYLGRVPGVNAELQTPIACDGMPLMCRPQGLYDGSTQRDLST